MISQTEPAGIGINHAHPLIILVIEHEQLIALDV